MNKVVIYTEKQGEDDNAEQIVKIFVEFRTSKGKFSFESKFVRCESIELCRFFQKQKKRLTPLMVAGLVVE